MPPVALTDAVELVVRSTVEEIDAVGLADGTVLELGYTLSVELAVR